MLKRKRNEDEDSQEAQDKREPYEVECDQCGTKYKTKIRKGWVCGSVDVPCRCGSNYTNFYCPVCHYLDLDVEMTIWDMEEKDPKLKESHEDREKYNILFESLKKIERGKRLVEFKSKQEVEKFKTKDGKEGIINTPL